MKLGFEFIAAQQKGRPIEDAPTQQRMRGDKKLLDAPSTDQKKARGRLRRSKGAADVTSNQEVRILNAMRTAPTLREQGRLAAELAQVRAQRTAAIQADRDVDLADAVIRDTLTPVFTHVLHTASTDWIAESDDFAPAGEAHHEMTAEASLWYGRTSPEVKADRDEFLEQAKGMARKLAGKYGEAASEAHESFMQWASHLWQREAASGLDQIDQTIDPNNDPKTTEYPTDVFDTFEQPLAPGNEADVSSERNPMWQTINNSVSGGAPGRPSQHDDHGTQEGHYGPGPVEATASLALQYHGSLADWTERFAKEAGREKYDDQVCKDCGKTFSSLEEASNAGDKCTHCGSNRVALRPGSDDYWEEDDPRYNKKSAYEVVARYQREGASMLDQITQTTAPDGVTEKPTPLPPEVAFPLIGEFAQEESTGAAGAEQGGAHHQSAPAPQMMAASTMSEKRCKDCGYEGMMRDYCPDCGSDEVSAEGNDDGRHSVHYPYSGTHMSSRKTADMFGNSDMPHAVPGGPVANSPATSPDESGGAAAGRADAEAGKRPTFADAGDHNNDGAREYADAYSQAVNGRQPGVQDVPPSLNGDRMHGRDFTMQQAAGSLSPDFAKAYKFARAWRPGARLVNLGSPAFEAGLYAGISENPAAHRAWLQAHAAYADRLPKLARRIERHREYTAALAGAAVYPKIAGTSTDLLTSAPETYPDPGGATPINGPGEEPPMAGGMNPAAMGGPAPWNGAEPMGSTPVAPDPLWKAPSSLPGPSEPRDRSPVAADNMNPLTMAFRRAVQTSLLKEAEDITQNQPTEENPTGVGDEYRANHYEDILRARPRQPASDRNINTPQNVMRRDEEE